MGTTWEESDNRRRSHSNYNYVWRATKIKKKWDKGLSSSRRERSRRYDNNESHQHLTHGDSDLDCLVRDRGFRHETHSNDDTDGRRRVDGENGASETAMAHRHQRKNQSLESARYGNGIVLLFLASGMFAVASVGYILPFFSKSNRQNTQVQPSNSWNRRKISSFKSKVLPSDEEAEVFFRTGKLPTHNKKEERKDKATQPQIMNDSNSLSDKSSQLKRNRILYGSKFTSGMAGWPPLSNLIGADGNVASGADVSGLLDFAIIGFAKTGTSSMLRHLSDITDVLPGEHCDLVVNETSKLIKDIYDDHDRRLKQMNNVRVLEERLRGLKCPQDLSSDWSMNNYAQYFPRTKLIVGIRHPVFWFESLYNFRVSNVPWKKMLPTSNLTKGCIHGSQGVCAWRASFHDFLYRLGKTSGSKSELQLLQLGLDPVPRSVGPVFLYELSQLSQSANGKIRSLQFRADLQNFLGLSKEIPPFPHVDTSGRFNFLPDIKQQIEQDIIDICMPEHVYIRAVLVEKAKMASVWIRDYFLNSDEVFVSSRQHFLEIMASWMHDPCDNIGRFEAK